MPIASPIPVPWPWSERETMMWSVVPCRVVFAAAEAESQERPVNDQV